MTNNDKRVLRAVGRQCEEYDAFAPHGSAEWRAVRRLCVAGFARMTGELGMCVDCDSQRHREVETWIDGVVLTDAGKSLLAEQEAANGVE